MNEKIKTGIYIRVSTEDQAKDGFSIHAQREKLTKYAEANDWDIYDYYVDDGISGKNLDGRPEVTRLLKDIEEGKVNNVLIYKLDRLTRSVRDLIYLIELFEKHNCTFNSQTEKIDTSNAVGRMFVKIIGIFAEFERENLAERVSFGYEQKTKEGNYTNTYGVYGYDYIVGEQKLVVNDDERKLVNRIFDMYIEGKSYHNISKTFNLENVPTKRGGNWSSNTIKSIINNPLYLGKVRYGVNNKIKEKAFTVNGKDIEPIIDEEKWKLANSAITTRKKYNVRRYPSENSYFFHTIKCSKCGGKISARQQKQCGKMYITYKCNNTSRGISNCDGFSHNLMEKAFVRFLDKFKKIIPDESIMEKEKTKIVKANQKEDIQKKIDKLKNKQKMIRKDFLNDLISIDEYRDIILEIEENKKVLEEQLSTFKQETKENNNYSYDDIKKIVSNIKLNWQYLTNKEKREFLERFIEEIDVEKDDNEVVIKNILFKKM